MAIICRFSIWRHAPCPWRSVKLQNFLWSFDRKCWHLKSIQQVITWRHYPPILSTILFWIREFCLIFLHFCCKVSPLDIYLNREWHPDCKTSFYIFFIFAMRVLAECLQFDLIEKIAQFPYLSSRKINFSSA